MEHTWGRPGLADAIVRSLQTSGLDMDSLTVQDLAPLDQFHNEGRDATLRLARLAGLTPGLRVLDAGGGLGGSARTLAVEFECDVTVLDPTTDYLEAGRTLTALLHLEDRVHFVEGSGLALPFDDDQFDVVWTQNSGMNIPNKAALYREFYRVLGPGGRLALQEPAAGRIQPPHFPLMWALDSSTNFLVTPRQLRDCILSAGFSERFWHERVASPPGAPAAPPQPSTATIQQLVRGDLLPAIQQANALNREERRMTAVEGCFGRY